jgi:hypothetical protein
MNGRWWILAALAFSPLATAQSVMLLPSPLEMPDRIGPLHYTGKPSTWPDKRLGIAYSFNTPGMVLDVYVYDAGETDIPDGPASRAVCTEFENAKLGVLAGGYQDLSLKREQLARMGPTQEPPLAREAVFEAVMKEVPSVSYVWITGAANHFIKLRFSANAKLRDELADARRAVLTTLGDAIRPHLKPPAPANDDAGKKPAGTVIAVNLEDGDVKEIGFIYLMAVSSLAENSPDSLPPCGGTIFPNYDVELGAFRSALAMAAEESGGSKFAKQLAATAEAGYLEEFVWTYRHLDFWGDSPPAGLELDQFRTWSRKHLKRLKVPHFGHVEVTEPRALAVEPVE